MVHNGHTDHRVCIVVVYKYTKTKKIATQTVVFHPKFHGKFRMCLVRTRKTNTQVLWTEGVLCEILGANVFPYAFYVKIGYNTKYCVWYCLPQCSPKCLPKRVEMCIDVLGVI